MYTRFQFALESTNQN